jgi:ribosomal protein L11 methyltransferase
VTVRDDDVDLISGLLWSSGVSAVAEHPTAHGTTLLRTDLPPGGVDAVRATVGHLADVHENLIADDGLDAWRDHAAVVVAGERVVVHPPWIPLDTIDLPPDPVVIDIDPERSWGHGAHPTTRLCLAEVELACRERVGMSVLDIGCGSGVLGIAAALLGAASALAIDIDDAAVAATSSNATRNGVSDRITVLHVDATNALAEIREHHDLLVANIGAAALIDLAPSLVDRARDDAVIILSGLLEPVDPRIERAFAPWRTVRSQTLDGWVVLVLQAPGSTGPPVVGNA